MVPRPYETTAIDAHPTRASWEASAEQVVQTMLQRWRLEPGDRFLSGAGGATLAVTREDGGEAVLKVVYPHVEALWEPVALSAWRGLAPEVLDSDPWTWALLLERVRPGTPLSEAHLDTAAAVSAGARVLAGLHRVRPPRDLPGLAGMIDAYLQTAGVVVDDRAEELDDLDIRVELGAALDDLRTLASDPGPRVMLHGDANPGNILQHGDASWRAIDAKPVVGDPAFDPWPLIAQLGDPWSQPDPAQVLLPSLRRVAGVLGARPLRIARWCAGRTALDVTWHLADGDLRRAARSAEELRVFGGIVSSGA